MKTFCFIITQSLESPGGSGRYFPLAKALVKRGFNVDIIALHHDYKNASIKNYVRDGVNIHYVGQMHVLKKNNNKVYFSIYKFIWIALLGTFTLSWNALKSKADVMLICKAQPMNTIAAFLVKLFRGKPILLDADDYETLNNRFTSNWQKLIVAYFEKLAYRISNSVSVSNTYLYSLAQKFGVKKERLILIPHGYDRDRFNVVNDEKYQTRIRNLRRGLNLSEDCKVILFVGSLSLLTHSIDLLVDAFRIVLSKSNKVVLVLAGRGEDYQSLISKVKENGIEENVRFPGFIDPSDVPLLFEISYLSCDPKRDGELSSSTLSLKLIESIAAGIPCVAADIGDTKDILDGAGISIPPGDSSELAKGILGLIEDEDLYQQMKNRAIQIREQLSWDFLVDRFIAKYEQYC